MRLLNGVSSSRGAPYPVAITGVRASIASAIVSPKPSERCSET